MNLRQHGAEITGTAGPDEEQQWPIANGRIDGGKLSFEVLPPEAAAVRFDLRVVDGRLQGETRAQGQGRLFRAVVRVKLDIV